VKFIKKKTWKHYPSDMWGSKQKQSISYVRYELLGFQPSSFMKKFHGNDENVDFVKGTEFLKSLNEVEKESNVTYKDHKEIPAKIVTTKVKELKANWKYSHCDGSWWSGNIERPRKELVGFQYDELTTKLSDNMALFEEKLSENKKYSDSRATYISYEDRATLGVSPIEVRVQTIWGKAHTGVYFPTPFSNNNPNNAFIVYDNEQRQWKTKFLRYELVHFDGELDNSLSWKPMEESEREKLHTMFNKLMPHMAKRAEDLAANLGVPFLRVDFFVEPDENCKEKCVTMNEVAQSSNIMYHDPVNNGEILPGSTLSQNKGMTNNELGVWMHWNSPLLDLTKALVDGYKERAKSNGEKPTLEAKEIFQKHFNCTTASDYKTLKCTQSD